MPDYRLAARRAAIHHGVDPNIFLRMIGQESGFQPHVKSPAGAQGIAQFMPATAKAYGVNLNDNRVTDDLEGAAKYLRANLDRTGGSYTRALSIYNSGQPEGYKHIAETRNYVRSILGGSTPRASARPSSSGGDSPGLATALTGSVTPGQVTGGGFDPGSPGGVSLADLLGSRPQPVASQLPAAPFSASKYLHGGQVPSIAPQQTAPQNNIDTLLGALQTQSQDLPQTTVSAPKTSVSGSTGSSGPKAHTSRASGSFRVAPGANLPGHPLTPGLERVLRSVAAQAGNTLTVGTGTRHSLMTASGNVSEHPSGNAADVPARGRELVRLGQDALIAAGMPSSQARKQQGGLFNVPYGHHRRIQIIFNTHEGGDHTDHLHVGVTPLG